MKINTYRLINGGKYTSYKFTSALGDEGNTEFSVILTNLVTKENAMRLVTKTTMLNIDFTQMSILI
jgi:hypothetical protein